jgi:hypothetical protein
VPALREDIKMTAIANRGRPLPSVAELAALFRYDPMTGQFWRLKTKTPVRTKSANGYFRVRINGGNEIPVHRIIWKMMTGFDPRWEIDHVNGVRHDNRWKNLREATRKQNNHNMPIRSDNKTGFKGVGFSRGRYIARIIKDGKKHYLGSFWSPEEASEAYKKAAIELHAEFSPAHRERNEIIERCAQVAEGYNWDNQQAIQWEIAAAIRELKNTKAGADPNLIYPGKDADFVFPEE